MLQHFWSDHRLERSKAMNELQKRSNDLEWSKFRQQVQSFVCVRPWRRVTFKSCEMLKNASEVALVPKKYFLPRNFERCAKFRGVQSKPCWWYVWPRYYLLIVACSRHRFDLLLCAGRQVRRNVGTNRRIPNRRSRWRDVDRARLGSPLVVLFVFVQQDLQPPPSGQERRLYDGWWPGRRRLDDGDFEKLRLAAVLQLLRRSWLLSPV